jgi:disulfide bond formation protein DsbB
MHNFQLTMTRLINAGLFAGILLTIILAMVFQIFFHELPCPLCLLQRFGYFAMAFGILLNFRFGYKACHYSIVLVSALLTMFIALRQIALHVVPGTGTYGSAILGLHMYTWSYIFSMLVIIGTSIVLGFDAQYHAMASAVKSNRGVLVQTLFAVVAVLLVANITLLVLMCGFSECPDDPIVYKLLS